MKKVLTWIGIVLGGLIALVMLLIIGLYASTAFRLNKTYNIQPQVVVIPKDPAAVERGKHWASIHCAGCHGDDLAGTNFFDDKDLGRVPARNLTSGKGGIGGTFSDTDWVRAIRHGVKPDGKPLFIMPANDFYYLSDGDLGDIIAYVKSVKPVDKAWDNYTLMPLTHILIAVGAFGNVISAETIDPAGARPPAPSPGVTAAYGEYLVKTGGCRTCHGADLAGGKDPNPAAPPAPNLTQGGELRAWSEADFIKLMRTGVTLGGRQLSDFMPWKNMGRMSDDELKAIWLYIKSLPAKSAMSK